MLYQNLFIFLSWIIFPILAIAIPTSDKVFNTQGVTPPTALDKVADNPIWARIREIGETSSNKDADTLNLIKGTFLDPEIIAATKSSSDPIAQGEGIHCDTSPSSPRYLDSIHLFSIVFSRSEDEFGPVRNPGGGACTEHATYSTSHFGICSSQPTWMTWKTLGTFAFHVTTACMQHHHGTRVSGGRNEWNNGQDVRVY
ncbi:hypothetical protein HOY82DRAFT_537215 [Tuber indicum]|nr:hypothetical protein HOY82DRAFT_537215 [Tuber indicum]